MKPVQPDEALAAIVGSNPVSPNGYKNMPERLINNASPPIDCLLDSLMIIIRRRKRSTMKRVEKLDLKTALKNFLNQTTETDENRDLLYKIEIHLSEYEDCVDDKQKAGVWKRQANQLCYDAEIKK